MPIPAANPVRVVAGGGRRWRRDHDERRRHFPRRIRPGRTGDVRARAAMTMSAPILYRRRRRLRPGDPVHRGSAAADVAATAPSDVKVAIERGLVTPRTPGVLGRHAAGVVVAEYPSRRACRRRQLTNVYVLPAQPRRRVDMPSSAGRSGRYRLWGNFYAIVEPQAHFRDMADFSAADLVRLSPVIAAAQRAALCAPDRPAIRGSAIIL